VSTRVPDVVSDFSAFVRLEDDGAGFAEACVEVVGHDTGERDERLAPVLKRYRWDWIADAMATHMTEALASVDTTVKETA
jgi:hypothetical protein